MHRLSTLLCCTCLLFAADPTMADQAAPDRVVSINLCTDQLLLMLAAPEQIASISYLAQDPESSFMVDRALAYPVNHARLEEVIGLEPDLVLAGAYSQPRLLHQLTKLGIRVEQFPLTHSITGIQRDIQRMARLLGRTPKGEELIETMLTEIRQIQNEADHKTLPKALFYQPRGYTSGSHTLQDEALRAAGWRNIAADLGIEGYAPIDLEVLLLSEPQQIFTSSHTGEADSRAQRQLRHPALERLTKNRSGKQILYKYWICAGPMIADAIRDLHAAHVQ